MQAGIKIKVKEKRKITKNKDKRREGAIAVSHGNENWETGARPTGWWKLQTKNEEHRWRNWLLRSVFNFYWAICRWSVFIFILARFCSFICFSVSSFSGWSAGAFLFLPTHARCLGWCLIVTVNAPATASTVFFFQIAFCSPYCRDRLVLLCCSFLYASFFCFILLNLILHVWIAPSAQEKTSLR